MFATFKIGQDDREPVCVQKNLGPVQGYQQQFACNPCREKKLKCSRDKDGCDRCRAKDLSCTYLEGKPNRKGKRQNKPVRSSSVNGSGTSPGASADSTSTGSGETNGNNKRNFTASPQPDQDQNISPSLLTLSPFDKMETIHDPLSFMKDSDLLDAQSLCQFGPGTQSLWASTPDPSSLGNGKESMTTSLQMSPLGLDTTSRNLLDLPSGTTEPQCLLKDHTQTNELWAHTVSNFTSPKTPGRPLNRSSDALRKSSKPSLDPTIELDLPPSSSSSLLLFSSPFLDQNPRHPMQNRKYTRCSPCQSVNRPSQGVSSFDHLKRLFPTPESTSLLSCQCMRQALMLYEEIESRKDAATVDYFLLLQKTILRECNKIGGCKDCIAISGISMLLITICERLLSSFQQVSDICLGTLGYHQRPRAGSPHCRRAPGNEEDGNAQKVFIGNYNVEAPLEQALLVIRVVEVQLRGLYHFLAKLWDVAAHSSWENHLSRVQWIKEQTEQTLHDLVNTTNDVFDDFPSHMS